MLDLFPEGFEEREGQGWLELAAYTNAGGEERLRLAFGTAAAEEVAPDWQEGWRRFHRPVRVGALWVGPPWLDRPDDALCIVIDPGRAFGTGSHPTTRLCLELLQELPRGSLVDVGCGSGVVAIAGVKLGYEPVVAIDNDPAAIEAAEANAGANGVELEARLADLTGVTLPEAETAVANITLDAVETLAPRLRSEALIASGYLASERPFAQGFRHVERRQLDGWVADLLERAE
jgi:ribosomal protein L11 methyltransferase